MHLKKLLCAAIVFAASLNANASVNIVDGQLYVADTGSVTATFLGSDAGYTDVVFFTNTGTELFNGHATAPGTTFNLGTFAAGTALNFRLHVNDTGLDFFTGPGSHNPDGQIHANAWVDTNGSAVVGFEDLQGGGDRDYNDLQFRVSNVSAVPEPETFGMMLGGLGLLGFLARRRNAKKSA